MIKFMGLNSLDDDSVVVMIDKDNGYVKAFIDDDDIALFVYSKHHTVVFEKRFSLAMLKDKDASEQYSEQQIDDNSWHV